MVEQEQKTALSSSEEVDKSTRPAKRSFGTKVVAHFKKWWWAHLILFIAGVLIVTLCV